MGIKAAAKNHLQLPKNVFTTNNFEICNLKSSNSLYGLIFLKSFACHLDVICMRSCLIYMYSYFIRMSLVCNRMSFVCHSYVLVSHPHVTRMYSYVIRISLVCTRMSLVCTRMSFVCHSYELVCHSYVTRMWFYHEPFFTI